MSRQWIFGIVLALAAPLTNAYAQARPLTLRAAIEEATSRNAELAALRAQYEAARVAPAQERFLAPPMLETQIWGWPVTTANPARTDMYMFTAEQEIPGRGKRAARVLVGEREAELSRQEIALRANQLLGEVRNAYVDLAFTREAFALYARQAKLLADVAETATLRYSAGEGVQHHTIVALVEVANVEKARIGAIARAEAAEARLSTLLGRPPSQPVEALAPITAAVATADVEERALVRHPDVAVVAAEVAREEAELERLRGELRPDFVVGGGYMLMPGEAGAWTARAGITWPNAPWARGRLTAAIEAQSKRVEAAKARAAVVSIQLRQGVREAIVRLDAAERQLRLIQSTVLPQIEHAFELTRLEYATGGGSFSDMLDARRTLLSTELEYLDARANVARARADLDTLAGVL